MFPIIILPETEKEKKKRLFDIEPVSRTTLDPRFVPGVPESPESLLPFSPTGQLDPTFQPRLPKPTLEMQYQGLLDKVPQRADYKPKWYEKLLAGVAGMYYPQEAHGVRDRRYNEAVQDWAMKIGAIKPLVDLETENRKLDFQNAKLAEAAGYHNVLGSAATTRAGTGVERANILREEVGSKMTHRQIQDKYTQWKMDNPKLDDLQFIYNLPEDEQQDALDIVNQMHKNQKETPEEAAAKTSAREEARINTQYENKDKLSSITAATGGAREASVLKEKAKAPLSTEEQDMVSGLVEQAKKNPDTAWDFVKTIPGAKAKARYISQVVNIAPSKILDTNERRVVDSAKTAILHANTLKEYLKDPDIQKAIGPITGRLTEAGQIVGKSVYNTGPAARKEAEFLNLLKYLILFESSSVSGTRPSWQLINYLKTTQGAHFDIDKAYGNLDAAIESAGIRLQGIYGASNRGKDVEQKPGFKVRIVGGK